MYKYLTERKKIKLIKLECIRFIYGKSLIIALSPKRAEYLNIVSVRYIFLRNLVLELMLIQIYKLYNYYFFLRIAGLIDIDPELLV